MFGARGRPPGVNSDLVDGAQSRAASKARTLWHTVGARSLGARSGARQAKAPDALAVTAPKGTDAPQCGQGAT